MDKEKIEALGYIVKKETLATLQSAKHLAELVLEDMAPFPGYYDHYNVPMHKLETIPRSVFIIVKSYNGRSEDELIRLIRKIKGLHPEFIFDAVFGQLTLFNEVTHCIRLKLDDLTIIPEIIRFFKNAGVEFTRNREVKEYQSIIRVRKFIEMNKLDEGIYQDMIEKSLYYLVVPNDSSWDDFEIVAKTIRNNYEFKHFDAAQGYIYRKTGLVDLVRIFATEIDLGKLQYLRDKFYSELKRLAS